MSDKLNTDGVGLDRRLLIKSAMGVAATAFVPTTSAQAAPTPGGYLWLQAHLAQTASQPNFTRVFPSKLPESRYIEFATKAATFGTSSPQVNQMIDVYLPAGNNLYFSEDPPPASDTLPIAATTFHQVPLTPAPTYTGMVLTDGSPALVTRSPNGAPIGVSGQQKDGAAFSISLSVASKQFPGRASGIAVSWAVCTATILSGTTLVPGPDGPVAKAVGAPLLFSFCFSPEADLAMLALCYEDVRTSAIVDLSTITGALGYSRLRRVGDYFGQPFSQQTLDNPKPTSAVALPLLAPPVGRVIGRISAFAPALAEIVKPAPSGSPLIPLASLDPAATEARAHYVSRGLSAVAGVLPALAAATADTSRAGLPDLARWMGWAIVADQTSLANAFGATFDGYQAFLKSSGAGAAPFEKHPIMKDGDTDALSDQILDWVYDQLHK